METTTTTTAEAIHDWSAQLRHLIALDSESKDGGYAVFIRLWNGAAVRHAVDGGTNYLFDLQQQQQQLLVKSKESSVELLADPHLLTGDMDSVRAEVLTNYKQNPITEVVETPDQDETDFTKAIQVLAKRLQAATTTSSPTKVSTIIVFYTGSTARLDHGLSIFSTLYRFGEDIDQGRLPRLVLVDLGSSISFPPHKSKRFGFYLSFFFLKLFLVLQGKHRIPTVPSARWCSLVPLNGPVRLVTTGFRWNLTAEDQLEFGRFISTSQEFDGRSAVATVEVLTERQPAGGLLFSVDFS
ncbi:cAMP-dependent protein kinase subunit [Tyrophagus putrescentiae]|nr:cAMP-dependent protein kinase subunit [Tyrophagus putrescentiae]